jgi:hypothetical protein
MTDLERTKLLALYTSEMRRDAWVPGLALERLPEVSRCADAAQREALIMWHHFAAADTEAVVRRELDHFKEAKGFVWKVYVQDSPANLEACLLAHGLQPERSEPDTLLAAPAAALAEPITLPAGVHIHELKSSSEIHLLAAVWDAVWPGEAAGWIAVLGEALEKHPDRLRILIAMVDGQPAASGYAILDPRGHFAYLGGGACVPGHRSKGLYRALVHARAVIVRDAKVGHLAVEATPASRSTLERLGFEPLTTLRFFAKN